MPKKKEKEIDLNLTKVSVTSRRSAKFGYNDFFTFECMLESNVEGLKEAEINERMRELWTKANTEVDNQFDDVQKMYKKDDD